MSSLFEPDDLPPVVRKVDPRADAFLRPVSETQPPSTQYPADEATAEAQARAHAFAAGLCDVCRTAPMVHYLSCEDKHGNHLPNRFLCDACLPAAEAEAKTAGRYTRFPADLGLNKLKGETA
jgi:hypothetical protein